MTCTTLSDIPACIAWVPSRMAANRSAGRYAVVVLCKFLTSADLTISYPSYVPTRRLPRLPYGIPGDRAYRRATKGRSGSATQERES